MVSNDGIYSERQAGILNAAIGVFGRYGFRKTSVDDLAEAAGLSKQGLYLHFSSKQEIFLAALTKYLDDGLVVAQRELTRSNVPLFNRLLEAMDSWFGRHLATFAPESFDVIETGDQLSSNVIDLYKDSFRALIAKALSDSPEFKRARNVCSPKDIAQVLFICGLSWKEPHASRAAFTKKMALCIRACCQIEP